MSGVQFQFLAYLGPKRPSAQLSLTPGLNVICGASETGKSFIVETIDFMLGGRGPLRDIPERDGYDRVRLVIESSGWPPLTLDRSVEGGNFRSYEEILTTGLPQGNEEVLRWQHKANRKDTLSFALLERTGLASKVLRRNAQGDTRSLSFRDMARLFVVTEEEIQGRGSPLLSGQHMMATEEYAAFKLLLTGTDDSALVATNEDLGRRELNAGKIELLDGMIAGVQSELDEEGVEVGQLDDQLAWLEDSIRAQNEALFVVQRSLDSLLERRGMVSKEIRARRARVAEIDELVGRFNLLDSHYQTDLERLAAIEESGSLFVHLEQQPCPLCGAVRSEQHLDSDCEGNTEAVVRAASAEIEKVVRLRRELADTAASLRAERQELLDSLTEFQDEYKACQRKLNDIASPAVKAGRTSYETLVTERAEVRSKFERVERLNWLTAQRAELEGEGTSPTSNLTLAKTHVSKNILNEFAKTVEGILQNWHFPNASRIFFDESARDFQIAGKGRGSTGKGLRAITHAAVKIGILEFCRDRGLPHPGFVVLDSPLLAYYKPEGDDDDLRGTDLKDRFYQYLLNLGGDSQVIIAENEHPPESVVREGNVVVFTKNPHEGRYGFFPLT